MKNTKLIFISLMLGALVGCGGGGGSPAPVAQAPAPAPVTPPVVVAPTPTPKTPLPVLASSYLNAKASGLTATTVPVLPANAQREQITTTYASADFFQDGTVSMVAVSAVFSANNVAGKVYFFKKDANGAWQDKTASMLKETAGCISPRKVLVADFNGDSKPDVFIACHGIDVEPFPGENQRVLLSQADGTYANNVVAFSGFVHSASAAEITNKGYADIVIVDSANNKPTPVMLLNNKNGTFTADYSRFPKYDGRPAYTVEFVDFQKTGKFDVLLAGVDNSSTGVVMPTTLLTNNGIGVYNTIAPVVFPDGAVNTGVLDLVYTQDALYLLRVNNSYKGSSIQKIDLKTKASSVIFGQESFPTGKNGGAWLDWMIPVNGKLVSQDVEYGVSVAM